MKTDKKLLRHAFAIFAREGYEGISMRKLARACGIAPSVIYHHYTDKDQLLAAAFEHNARELGQKRALLPDCSDAAAMLRQRIEFQLDHAETVVAVLKYYLHYRDQFAKNPTGYVPETAYLHIREVLERGVVTGEFIAMDIDTEAKVITHAINGFLLEYYPKKPRGADRDVLVDSIHTFVMRSIAA